MKIASKSTEDFPVKVPTCINSGSFLRNLVARSHNTPASLP